MTTPTPDTATRAAWEARRLDVLKHLQDAETALDQLRRAIGERASNRSAIGAAIGGGFLIAIEETVRHLRMMVRDMPLDKCAVDK
jgi:hypothetical protein